MKVASVSTLALLGPLSVSAALIRRHAMPQDAATPTDEGFVILTASSAISFLDPTGDVPPPTDAAAPDAAEDDAPTDAPLVPTDAPPVPTEARMAIVQRDPSPPRDAATHTTKNEALTTDSATSDLVPRADPTSADSATPTDAPPVITDDVPTADSSNSTTVDGPEDVPYPDYEYIGCYSDDVAARTLHNGDPDDNEFIFKESDDMTVPACITYCAENSEVYAGLEFGRECFCGNSLQDTERERGKCHTPCAGASSQTCGGDSLLSVYKSTLAA
ncbi:WSC domain-containing protein [Massariosphaeria phaeospora]|uniref:WSC domain-containing protein n=1 Tax=Massariosphaeria phaeospora TaxID=100035 RepID=A0A7C8MFM0_9PLEO|nr:WSC domain-containing protein [Massariosphaeria phaeospora]